MEWLAYIGTGQDSFGRAGFLIGVLKMGWNGMGSFVFRDKMECRPACLLLGMDGYFQSTDYYHY